MYCDFDCSHVFYQILIKGNMQDVASSPALLEHVSRISDDYLVALKPATATTRRRRQMASRRTSFRPDLTASARITNRHNKKLNYAPPASDRESWWRVSIKV
jgi:hypothetical protein